VRSVECRNESADNHFLKHPKIERRLQTSVGKQQSLCSLQNAAVQSPSSQRRMSKQWSMPLSSSVSGGGGVETTGGGASGHTTKDSRTTSLSESSSSLQWPHDQGQPNHFLVEVLVVPVRRTSHYQKTSRRQLRCRNHDRR